MRKSISPLHLSAAAFAVANLVADRAPSAAKRFVTTDAPPHVRPEPEPTINADFLTKKSRQNRPLNHGKRRGSFS